MTSLAFKCDLLSVASLGPGRSRRSLSHLSGASERPRPMEYLGGGVSGFKWGFSTTRPADGWGHISSVAGELCVSELYSLFVFFSSHNVTGGLTVNYRYVKKVKGLVA